MWHQNRARKAAPFTQEVPMLFVSCVAALPFCCSPLQQEASAGTLVPGCLLLVLCTLVPDRAIVRVAVEGNRRISDHMIVRSVGAYIVHEESGARYTRASIVLAFCLLLHSGRIAL
jgi:hypothetical protein